MTCQRCQRPLIRNHDEAVCLSGCTQPTPTRAWDVTEAAKRTGPNAQRLALYGRIADRYEEERMSMAQLARELGVSETTVQRAVSENRRAS